MLEPAIEEDPFGNGGAKPGGEGGSVGLERAHRPSSPGVDLRTPPRDLRSRDSASRDQRHHPTPRRRAGHHPPAEAHLHNGRLIFSNTRSHSGPTIASPT